MKLDGKTAVITGGAMGIGKGIVEVYLKYGANVIILDYNEALTNTLTELNAKYPNKINGFIVDIRSKEVLEACAKEIEKRFGHIDILVNNAGVCKLETFENMNDETRDFHFDININGTWNVTKIFLPLIRKTGKGAIINLSSVTGPMVADSGEVAYATSKGAVLAFTKGLAMEVVKDNIRVNAIMPGYVKTPLVDNMAILSNKENPNSVVDGIAAAIPMGRLADPKEIGELAAFLGSEESSYITGQGIVIDGGSTLPETNSMGV